MELNPRNADSNDYISIRSLIFQKKDRQCYSVIPTGFSCLPVSGSVLKRTVIKMIPQNVKN